MLWMTLKRGPPARVTVLTSVVWLKNVGTSTGVPPKFGCPGAQLLGMEHCWPHKNTHLPTWSFCIKGCRRWEAWPTKGKTVMSDCDHMSQFPYISKNNFSLSTTDDRFYWNAILTGNCCKPSWLSIHTVRGSQITGI